MATARDRRAGLLLLLLPALLAPACGGGEGGGFAAEPWLADLAELEALAATTYANFEWAVSEGGIDPVALDRRTRRELRAAASDGQARRALERFVDGFGDGHFRLREPRPPAAAGPGAAAPGPETPGSEACAALGYEEHDQSLRLDLGERFHFTTDPGDPLPAGWLERGGGGRLGFVRIDEFGANRFGEYCPESWERYRRGLERSCDDWDCEYGFRLALVDRLLDEIAARVRALVEAGIVGLVIDVTGNGGGSDWVDPAARMLSDRVLLGNGRSLVRHPHWTGILEQMAADVAADLAREELTPAHRALLAEVGTRLRAGIAESGRRCDLSHVWTQGAGELPCSLLVRDVLFTTGLLAAPPPVPVADLTSAGGLFKALDYGDRPTIWRGPLAVLTDRATASAAELFVVLLRDNDAAIVVGERTFGAGCGYSNGGIQTLLGHSGLEVWPPDCVRQRRGGGNERAGIVPDRVVDWRPDDDPRARGEKLVARLAGWPAAAPR